MSTKKKRGSKGKGLVRALIICIVALLALLLALIIYPMLLPKVDPFDYVNLTFTGETGQGTASIERRTDLVGADATKIDYTLSKDQDLVQGEVVTLTASSRSYNLIETVKEYTVSGLDESLKNVRDLSDEAIAEMHEKTEAVIQMNIGDPSDSFGVRNELIKMTPSRIYLLTAEDGSNILYDLYRAEFRSANGQTKAVYLVAYYKNVLINLLDPGKFIFESCMYTGEVVSLGEDAVNDSVVTGYSSLKAAKEALVDEAGEGMTFTHRKAS